MSDIVESLKKATATATIALAGVFSAGCVTTTGPGTASGLPSYGNTQAPTRAANTSVDQNGIRYNPDGSPMAGHYNACAELNRTIAATRPSNGTNRAIAQGAGAIGGAIAGGRNGNIGNVAAGVAIGIIGQIAGDKANQVINNDRIAQTEADCNQQRAYEAFIRKQNPRSRSTYGR